MRSAALYTATVLAVSAAVIGAVVVSEPVTPEPMALLANTASIGIPRGIYAVADQPPMWIDGERFFRPMYSFVAVPIGGALDSSCLNTLRGGNVDEQSAHRCFRVEHVRHPEKSGYALVPVRMDARDHTHVAMWLDNKLVMESTRVMDLAQVTENRP